MPHRFEKWRDALRLAPDVKAVEGTVRDYVETIRPMLGALPESDRRVVEMEPDIQAAAVRLLQAELRFEGPEDQRILLHEIAHTFASAAVRLTLLHTSPMVAAASRARPRSAPSNEWRPEA